MTLRELDIGKSGKVLTVMSINNTKTSIEDKALRKRLLDMGITPGTKVTVKKTAPMGDPIEIILRGYVLSLRLSDAEKITIEEIGE